MLWLVQQRPLSKHAGCDGWVMWGTLTYCTLDESHVSLSPLQTNTCHCDMGAGEEQKKGPSSSSRGQYFPYMMTFMARIMQGWEWDPGSPPAATREGGATSSVLSARVIANSPPNVSRYDSGASSGRESRTMAYRHLTADLFPLPLSCKWNSAAGSTHTPLSLNLCLQ